MKKILVIKHGSLGDIVFAIPAMFSIRKKYPSATIHLLTEKKYTLLLMKSKIFDKIIIDNRRDIIFKSIVNLFKLLSMKYSLIIDLQNSQRTSMYNLIFRLFNKALICSSGPFVQYRYKIPTQGIESARVGLYNQLKLLGIINNEVTNYNWLKVDLTVEIKKPIVLFIPGVSKGNENKQWQPEKFADFAQYCESNKFTVCVVGTKSDLPSAEIIFKRCKNAVNKIDFSPPETIYSIALQSSLIISNDTGPGHIASLSKNQMVWLLNDNSVSKANISNNETNHRILSSSVKNITSKKVIEYVQQNELLKSFN